jgi:hypothetical protein
MANWTVPLYSKSRVDKAGSILCDDGPLSPSELEAALEVINNWRSSHSYPLQVLKMALLGRARRVDERAIVAQRLKRLSSTRSKLRRIKTMKLSQMQDIGGCRAVVRNVSRVRRLADLYTDSLTRAPHGRPEWWEAYDYIQNPKPDGYRSYHIVFKYRSRSENHQVWDGLRIEVQLRSQLQHAWATAVETTDAFTGQALKSNVGDESWKRFFALMATHIAIRERSQPVPGIPTNPRELFEELRELTNELKVVSTLQGWTVAVQMMGEVPRREVGSFLLVLDPGDMTVSVTPFGRHGQREANDAYMATEKTLPTRPNVQAVLVSVESVASLRTAFPNYYLDTNKFLQVVQEATT